ncbi:MAG: hypothetical protein LM564_03790 [Desulfurococcaceae archaeon]|nr:hypothetical protein [Desulfurococcaceae archaeon]
MLLDHEGFRYLNESSRGTQLANCRVILVDRGKLSEIIRELIGDLRVVSLGVDLGKRAAYAVLIGGRLVKYGRVDSISDIRKVIEDIASLHPGVLLLGIGMEFSKSIPDEVLDLLESREVTRAYLVEEVHSNSRGDAEVRLPTSDLAKLPKDIRAAAVIANRAYEKYLRFSPTPSSPKDKTLG